MQFNFNANLNSPFSYYVLLNTSFIAPLLPHLVPYFSDINTGDTSREGGTGGFVPSGKHAHVHAIKKFLFLCPLEATFSQRP